MTVRRFDTLTTAHLADACLRAGLPLRVAPPGLTAVTPGDRLAGRVLPVRHAGSVDLYLEALGSSEPGDVLVVDNDGRTDEACVGDLVALEVQQAGLAGILIWGLHRDTADIRAIGLPVFSLGATPPGPVRNDRRASDALRAARVGAATVSSADAVFADEDGAVFIARDRLDEVFASAEGIRDIERAQADRIAAGDSLRSQVRFADYLTARREDPTLTFREHLRQVGGEIEV